MKRNRWWPIALGLVTAIAVTLMGQPWHRGELAKILPFGELVQAQSPSPSPSPSPESSPEASPSPSPPSELKTNNQTTTPILEVPGGPPIDEEKSPYKDPDDRFQVGILENFNVKTIRDVLLIESSDGKLAYTVGVQPRVVESELSPATLAQISVEYFQRGEGFVPDTEQSLPNGNIIIPWEGTLTQGRNTETISGKIFTKQLENNNVLMLMVSATEARRSEVDGILKVLIPTLKLPTDDRSSQ